MQLVKSGCHRQPFAFEREVYMNFSEYYEQISKIPEAENLLFDQAVFWVHPEILPLAVVSLNGLKDKIVKIPRKAKNRYGRTVPVITFEKSVFCGNETVTDIVLPSSISEIPSGAFEGCKSLERITVPRAVKSIKSGTFEGCKSLSDVYYEGTFEEWNNIDIVYEKHEIEFGKVIGGTPVQEIVAERIVRLPGNKPLFSATIHFNCKFEKPSSPNFTLTSKNKDVTDLFHTVK